MDAIDSHGAALELTKIAGDCDEDDCPAVSVTSRSTVAVQGYLLRVSGTPGGEAVVELPIELLRRAADGLC